MKGKLNLIVSIILVLFLLVFGIDFFLEYNANHQYYGTMLGSRTNWKILLTGILSASFPILYILKSQTGKFKLKRFFLSLFLGLVIFGTFHVQFKWGLVSMWAWFMLVINTLLIFSLGIYTLVSIYSLGEFLSSKLLKFKETRIQELFLNFGLGLSSFLVFVWILLGFWIFHPAVVWTLFIGGGVLTYFRRKSLKTSQVLVQNIFENLGATKLADNPMNVVILLLVFFAILYYFFGFQLSFIPYPTAWDANHAYMYYPKVLAEYNGVIWGNIGPVNRLPFLWHSFIAFFFSLARPLQSWFWLSADTIAIAMNFLSGILVLFFGLGVVHTLTEFFKEKKESLVHKSIFAMGFGGVLLWLSSGMGAFLVFVDNKTDLGVMALSLLAILGGLIAIQYIQDHQHQRSKKWLKEALKYLVVSGLFFTFASMAKPTAFIDVAIFGIFMLGLWFNIWIWAGVGTMLLGFMGILQPLNAKYFINPELWKVLLIIWWGVFLASLIRAIIKKQFTKKSKKYLIYLLVWGLAFGGGLVVFKTPWLVYDQYIKGEYSVSNLAKWLLLADKKPLTTVEEKTQTTTDLQALKDTNLTVDQCEKISFTEKELTENLPEVEVGNEDIGRYVGYGRKQFKSSDLWFYLFKLIFPKNNTCYGLNADAKVFCSKAEMLKWSGDIAVLQNIEALGLLKVGWEAEKLNQKTLKEYAENPDTLKYNLEKIRQYYQDHSVYTEKWIVNVPYRYIIPLNISFNWSLQNLSSYYTDIGFVWIIMMWIVIFSLIYALIKKEKKLSALSISVISWWMVRILIWGGIMRYGIGLIMRTIMVNIVFFQKLFAENFVLNTDGDNEITKLMGFIIFALLGLVFLIQILFNFIRISSQGGGQPFARYKTTVGQAQTIDEKFQPKLAKVFPYTWKKIFDMQFAIYNPILEELQDRKDSEWVLIAGTYIQYFMKNQKNLHFDTGLSTLANATSDGNVCKSYQRLKEKKIKTIIFDQNIGTVVMGEGNKSLFYRFFAKYNEKTNKIIEEGTISMLLKLKKYGYLDLMYTNNLGTKYAFIIPDEKFIEYFKVVNPDQIRLIRSKLAVARFFAQDGKLINFVAKTFQERFNTWKIVEDLADVFGKKIDIQKTWLTIQYYLSKNIPNFQKSIKELTEDEKFILLQYLNIITLNQTNPQQYNQMLSNLIQQSLIGSTQITAFEIK